MENQNQTEDLFDVEVDYSAKKHISEIAVWAKIVAITAFISYGISLIISIFRINNSGGGFAAATSRAGSMAFLFVIVIIFVILNIFLLKFATDAKNGVDNTDQGSLEKGFHSLLIYFKMVGVLIIIFISLFVITLLLTRGFAGGM